MENTVTQIPVGGGWCTFLGRNLYALYEKEQLTDATLSSRDGLRIRVHSCVLAASSPILAKRLQSGFTIWVDAPSAALRSFLKFVYCGDIDIKDQLFNVVVELIQKFEIVSVKHESGSSGQRNFNQCTSKKNNSPMVKAEINNTKANRILEQSPCHEMVTRSRSRPLGDIHARRISHQTVTSGSPKGCRQRRKTPTEKVPRQLSECDQRSSIEVSTAAAAAKSACTVSEKYLSETLEETGMSESDVEELVAGDSNKEFTDRDNSQDMEPFESLESRPEQAQVCYSAENGVDVEEAKLAAENASNKCVSKGNFDTVKESHLEKGFSSSKVKNRSEQNQEKGTMRSGGKCQYCGSFWNTFYSLRRHEKTHNTVTFPFQCPECPQSFKRYGRLSLHKRSKHPGLSLEGSCNICGWVPGSDNESLKKHVKDNHCEKSSWQCEKCGKSYTQKSALDLHIEAVHLKINHRCLKCDYTTRFKYCLTYHTRKAHMGEAFFKHQCETCGKRFIRLTELNDHRLQEHTSSNEWQFKCPQCPKRFPLQRKLNSHMVCHRSTENGSRRLKPCPECGQQFTASAMLEKHRHIVHLKDTACACDVCGRQFTHPSNLQRHMLRHTTSIRNYKCTTCGADFRVKEDLRRHERIHSAPKRFKCRYCDKLFLRKIFLREHERVHTREKPLKCDFCEARFRCSGNLSSHKRTQHPVEHAKKQQLTMHYVSGVGNESEMTQEHVADASSHVVYQVVYCNTDNSNTQNVQGEGDPVFQVMDFPMEQKDDNLSAESETSEEGPVPLTGINVSPVQ